MSVARFSILQGRAIEDRRVSDSQFRTLAALGTFTDNEGWCFPSLTTIGAKLGKSKQAAGRDILSLKKFGYIQVTARFDKTGGRRSNLYRLLFDLPRQREVDTPSTSEVDTPSTSEVDVNVPINVPVKLDEKYKKLVELYGNVISPVADIITSQMLGDAVDTYPFEWFEPAFKIAVENNARNWKYINTILKSWKEHEFGWKPEKKNGYGRGAMQKPTERAPIVAPTDDDREMTKPESLKRPKIMAEV